MSEAPRSAGFEHHPYAPQAEFLDRTVTSQARPLTSAVITVRVIKSFEYRTMKALVLRDIDLTTTTPARLIEQCRDTVRTQPTFKAYRNVADQLDTLKLYTHAHGAKTTNLIINLDHPEWIFERTDVPLAELDVQNETELSLFNRAAYDAFVADPHTRWDDRG